MTWKDHRHPLAGGAEVVQNELTKRLVKDGHNVTILTASYAGANDEDVLDGRRYVRRGNRLSVYREARKYYSAYLEDWADIVIDEVNTLPFMAKWYAKKKTHVLFHQLCREIWFYQLPPYIGWMGYITEPLYVRWLSNQPAITVSDSTKNDLVRWGFKPSDIRIISEGISIPPLQKLSGVKKFAQPTVLIHGSVRAMKRTLDGVKAFEIAKESLPDLRLKVSGDASDAYGKKVVRYIKNSRHTEDIEYLGRVSEEQKIELMQKSHAILATSVREGWGIIITEANSQGTPAVVYDIPGLRDSVKNGVTGIVTEQNPKELATGIQTLLSNKSLYAGIRSSAYDWSKTITFNRSYQDLKEALNI